MLFRQKNRGYREVVVGDDSELIARVGVVAGKDLKTGFKTQLVSLAVLGAQISPIATRMAHEKLCWSLSCFFERRERGDDLSQREERLFCGLFHVQNSFRKGLYFLL